MSPVLYHRKANGKLLLTGEYFVLDGAEALAIPTKYGQSLEVKTAVHFHWESKDEKNALWLQLDDFARTENGEKNKLIEIFQEIGENLIANNAYFIRADFPKNWGLGSSSTLIALLADYFKLNPYDLNRKLFQGSGYDIACAFRDTPILYENRNSLNPTIKGVEIPDEIQPFLYFVYLGKKQNSRKAIDYYSTLTIDKKIVGNQLSQVSEYLLKTIDYKDWISLLEEHETIISKNLNLERVKDTVLKGLPYFAKSLGAWGGDFAMIISDEAEAVLKAKFKNQNFSTFFSYKDIIFS